MAKTIHGRFWGEVAARHRIDPRIYPIGDGWADILDRLLDDLERMGWRWTPITRLEEKYGQLRFEAGNPNNPPSYEGWPTEWEARTTEAESESNRTCSRCGRPGDEVVIHRWIHKLCPVCAVEARTDAG